MAQMNTSHRYIYDAAPATLFKARTAAAITATADSSEVVLDALDGYWNDLGELADETIAVVVNVTALDTADADETYNIALVPTDGAAGALTGIDCGDFAVTTVGQYVFLVDIPTLQAVDSDLGGFKLTATLGGTTPSLTYHAWMNQIKK